MLNCHLDTYHWNRLAAGHLGADRFRAAVRDGKLAPALSFIHMLEFASRKPEETRAMLGDFLDEISSIGTVRWVHLRGSIQAAEYRNELNRFIGLPTRRIRVFEDCLTSTMPHDMDEELEADWTKEPLRAQLESIHSSPHRIDEHLEYRRNEHPSNVKKELREPWQQALWGIGCLFMPDGSLRPRTRQIETDFQQHLDLGRCQAVRFKHAYNTQWQKNPQAVHEQDYEDLEHLAAAAYCDVAFVDARTQDLLEKGGISPLPKRNGEFEDWLSDIYP